VLTVVVKGRLHDVVLGSGVGVETRGGVIIVVGADRFALRRNHLIARCVAETVLYARRVRQSRVSGPRIFWLEIS